MPVTQFHGAFLEKEQLFVAKPHLFVATSEDAIAQMRTELRDHFGLVVSKTTGGFSDLFSAVAQVAYKSGALRRGTAAMSDGTAKGNVLSAAHQLRAVTASQIARYYQTDEKIRKISELL